MYCLYLDQVQFYKRCTASCLEECLRIFLCVPVYVHSGVLSPRVWTTSSVRFSSTAHRGDSTLLPAELSPSHRPSTHRWSRSELTETDMTLRKWTVGIKLWSMFLSSDPDSFTLITGQIYKKGHNLKVQWQNKLHLEKKEPHLCRFSAATDSIWNNCIKRLSGKWPRPPPAPHTQWWLPGHDSSNQRKILSLNLPS